jgi:hypothetical protein
MTHSSLSSSEKPRTNSFILTFCVSVLLAALSTMAFLVVIDPYDTGRLTPLKPTGMFETGPRKAHASRMRDPTFDAAIFGNSTSQIISPERLNTLTRQSFVQLSVPGTGPMEQRAMIEHIFRLRGNGIRTIVLGFGYLWCDPQRVNSTLHPFPFWLYSASNTDYVSGLVRMDSIQSVPRRIQLLRHKERMARKDGFWDYETHSVYDGSIAPVVPELPMSKTGAYSASEALTGLLQAIPAQTQVILLHPPAYTSDQRQLSPQSLETKRLCKAELAAVAAKRPRTSIIDRWVDDVHTKDRSLFFDYNHYRSGFAKLIETDIANAVIGMK